jgi:hypothetical protein
MKRTVRRRISHRRFGGIALIADHGKRVKEEIGQRVAETFVVRIAADVLLVNLVGQPSPDRCSGSIPGRRFGAARPNYLE